MVAARLHGAEVEANDVAELLGMPSGCERNRAALAQSAVRGASLVGVLAPARPVGFAALAALAPATLEPRGPQQDAGPLG